MVFVPAALEVVAVGIKILARARSTHDSSSQGGDVVNEPASTLDPSRYATLGLPFRTSE